MEKSTSLKHIATALVSFHNAVGTIPKDSANPFFKSKYAALPDILKAIQQPLNNAGLVVSQFPTGNHGLTTILIHAESGEYIQDTYEMSPVKNDPQGLGSAITYQRRYALGAILNLNIDEDDDGNAASKKVNEPSTAQKVSNMSKASNNLSIEELENIQYNLQLMNDMAEFKAYFNKLTNDVKTDPGALKLFKKRKEELNLELA